MSTKYVILENIIIIKKKNLDPIFIGSITPCYTKRYNVFMITFKRYTVFHIMIVLWDLKYNIMYYYDPDNTLRDHVIYTLLTAMLTRPAPGADRSSLRNEKTPFIRILRIKNNEIRCAAACIKFVKSLNLK